MRYLGAGSEESIKAKGRLDSFQARKADFLAIPFLRYDHHSALFSLNYFFAKDNGEYRTT
jgi:hypothetical protein